MKRSCIICGQKYETKWARKKTCSETCQNERVRLYNLNHTTVEDETITDTTLTLMASELLDIGHIDFEFYADYRQSEIGQFVREFERAGVDGRWQARLEAVREFRKKAGISESRNAGAARLG